MLFSEAVRDFELRKPSVIDLTLDRIAEVAALLSDPQNAYPSIHIAGTNGKGSTTAFASTLLGRMGWRVGCYTSPHLLTPRERISIDGTDISEDDFASYYSKVLKLEQSLSSGPLTYFEIVTAMAFDYFADQEIDIAVLETGLGGRFDATNIITPALSVITRVAMDHQRWLGGTLQEIAREKCGIIKAGIPVVTIRQEDVVMRAIDDACVAAKAPLRVVDPLPERFKLGLEGAHQRENAALALAACSMVLDKELDSRDPPPEVLEALERTRWPGRLQRVSEDPLTFIDGAHNPNGVRALVDHLKKEYPDRRKIFVVNIMRDKSVEEMIGIMSEAADEWAVVPLKMERAEDPSRLVKLIGEISGKDAVVHASLSEALKNIKAKAAEEYLVCICGSLYLVAEYLSIDRKSL